MSPTPEQQQQHIAVVGGGVAGLATAVNLRDKAQAEGLNLRVTVFDKGQEAGGNLQTLREDGWQLEWGPNGFLDNEPATLRMVERLGLNDELLKSSDATRRRFLLVDGRIQEIPTSPKAFLASKMLSFVGKLRMAGELFIAPREDLGRAAEDPSTDETIAEFGRRRLGTAFTAVMLDPMVKGIFGGDAENLSLAASFPRMVELEKDHGGLFKAMIKLARERKKKKKSVTDAGPSGVLHSFKGGMGQLISAMTDALAADDLATVITGADVRTISQQDNQWLVATADHSYGPFTAVVEASPAHAAARHLVDMNQDMANLLGQIPFAPMAVIALGFKRNAVGHDLDGFGMLVPSKENRELLGALWTSSIFPGRAPEGHVLIRCMAGGSSNPNAVRLNDEDLTDLMLAELRPLLKLKGAPAMVKIIRHDRAIAQYTQGHLARLAKLESLCADYTGLHLTGSSYHGISVNYCMKEAEIAALDVISNLSAPAVADAEVN